MNRRAKDSLAYTLVFAIGYLVACTSANKTLGTIGSPSAPTSRMLNSTVRNTAIFPTNTRNQPVIASIFSFGPRVNPDATIANPSDLGQSFEALCTWQGANASGMHAQFGNAGLVPMLPARSDASIGIWNYCSAESASIASVGADENGNPTGYPIFDSGTINNLVAYGTFVSGKQFRCLDTSDTSTLQDSAFVRPYYDLAHDAVLLGSGTNQLAPTCSISIPPGDDVFEIQVQWIKS